MKRFLDPCWIFDKNVKFEIEIMEKYCKGDICFIILNVNVFILLLQTFFEDDLYCQTIFCTQIWYIFFRR